MRSISIYTVVFLAVYATGFGTVTDDVISKMQTRLEWKKLEVRITEEDFRAADSVKVLEFLSKYEASPKRQIRRVAYYYGYKLAEESNDLNVRQEVVRRLVREMCDPNNLVRVYNRWLKHFREKDFGAEARERIRESIQVKLPGKAVILACGVSGLDEVLPRLKELLVDEEKLGGGEYPTEWCDSRGWYARLARARMGVKEDIEKCIELVDSIGNVHFRMVTMRKDIGYIRQPEAIEYLRAYFMSDLKMRPTNPVLKAEPVAQYLMPALIDSLEGFPIKKDRASSYSEEEIEEAREWMSKQEEWKIKR